MTIHDRTYAEQDRMYVDADGDIWAYIDGGWRYTTDDGLTDTDGRSDLPEAYEPYTELSLAAAALVLRTIPTSSKAKARANL